MTAPHDSNLPWQLPEIVAQTQLILDSFRRLLGYELVTRCDDPLEESRRLFEHSAVVVSHGTQTDPVLNYGNSAALVLWETSFCELTSMPSRLTAEPMHREERAQLLERTTRDGYVDDYQGIRISKSGRRFRIRQAIVLNLLDADGNYAGQAATFSDYDWLKANPG